MTIFKLGLLAKRLPSLRVSSIMASLLLISTHTLQAAEDRIPPAELFPLQKELVDTLNAQLKKMQEENRVGQRTEQDLIAARQAYYNEMETACVMEVMVESKTALEAGQIVAVRIEIASVALETLRAYEKHLNDRYQVGEITSADVASAKAAALKAEIRLGTLKRQLKGKASEQARPCKVAEQLDVAAPSEPAQKPQ